MNTSRNTQREHHPQDMPGFPRHQTIRNECNACKTCKRQTARFALMERNKFWASVALENAPPYTHFHHFFQERPSNSISADRRPRLHPATLRSEATSNSLVHPLSCSSRRPLSNLGRRYAHKRITRTLPPLDDSPNKSVQERGQKSCEKHQQASRVRSDLELQTHQPGNVDPQEPGTNDRP